MPVFMSAWMEKTARVSSAAMKTAKMERGERAVCM